MIVNCYTTPILKITGLVANVLIHNIQHLRNDDTTRFEFRFRYIKILKNIIVANPSIKCNNDPSEFSACMTAVGSDGAKLPTWCAVIINNYYYYIQFVL